ncbi:glycoside hydrolase family 5 protein [Streptomyces boninensis]|uniref:glycoside hydrolase family 5 protein n=1 Tax=Streptomyces boninensis TaxID=2039455 RepID=UPI003B213D5F
MRSHRRSRRLHAAAAAAVATAALAAGTYAMAGTDDSPAPEQRGAASSPADTAAAPAPYGKLEVCGNQLCGADGKPVQLRGMSSHGMQWYAQCVTDASLGALASDWKGNTVRISTYVQENGYETDPAKFTKLAMDAIDAATAKGLYVIVDWHILNPGDPAHNTERAKTFFSALAEKYAGSENVIYEIANEPHGVSWQSIKDYAETIIPVIRERDADSVVLVGTRGWSSMGLAEGATEQEIVDSPVAAKNIMYTFHFYAATHRDNYLQTLERAAGKLPVFVSEFGLDEASGDGGNDLTMGAKYLDLMAEKKIGWTAWNYSDDAQSSAVFKPGTCASGDYAGAGALKESGTFLRERMRAGGEG